MSDSSWRCISLETSISHRIDLGALARSRRVWAALAVVLALGLAAAGVVLSRSSVFDVRHVEVDGAAYRSRADVVRLSGVSRATNALWLDEGSVERRLEQDPWIASATVSTSFPWTVHVQVVERTPAAVVDRGTDRLLVATDGTPLGLAGRVSGLPLIVMPPAGALEGAPPSLEPAARAVGGLPPSILARVRQVVVSLDGTLEMRLVDGPRVEFGPATQIDAKGRAIASMLAWSDEEGEPLATVNVVAPGAPAARPAP
jgi:cell division protein FtsQ